MKIFQKNVTFRLVEEYPNLVATCCFPLSLMLKNDFELMVLSVIMKVYLNNMDLFQTAIAKLLLVFEYKMKKIIALWKGILNLIQSK